jgi:hypothetical protein
MPIVASIPVPGDDPLAAGKLNKRKMIESNSEKREALTECCVPSIYHLSIDRKKTCRSSVLRWISQVGVSPRALSKNIQRSRAAFRQTSKLALWLG